MINYRKKHILILSISLLLCLTVILLNNNQTIITSSTNNIKILANGVEVETFPSKDEGFIYDGIICASGTTGTWNNSTWSLKINTKKAEGCIIYFYSNYIEQILNGAYPVLTNGLVPVTISETGTVKIADPKEEWYDYETNQWANAVVVNDSQFRGSNYGKVIPMEAIEQMYVWIPRYQYDEASIESAANAIDITFVNTTEEAHSAFTFGSEELPGFWAGKFEQGTDNTIKPDQNSLNNLNVSTLYTNVKSSNNTNGLSGDSDIHMIKNTEWGAIAYFSQSMYGVCNQDGTCTNKVENNNYYTESTYDITTGCGGSDAGISGICPNENRWNTEVGQGASTTQNITGIYDMAGGRFEYVFDVMKLSSGSLETTNSGFVIYPNNKYYNTINYGTSQYDFSRSISGDAIKELSPTLSSDAVYKNMTNWNNDFANYMNNSNSFIGRGSGSIHGENAGIFSFSILSGNSYSYVSTRSILAPVKINEYSYTGNYQTFTAPDDGYYKFEAWGAQGAGSVSKGAYTSGTIELDKGQVIYVYVGQGLNATVNTTSFNGGTGSSGGTPGGGATDFRTVAGSWNEITSLKSRIMVAAGSGSGSGNNLATEGAGGGLIGYAGGGTSGGTQLTFGAAQSASYTASSFGIANGGCAGGNGYYPGGGASCASGAGGGSSFISGYAGVNAILSTGGTNANPTPSYNTIHYSGLYFTDGVMKSGIETMPNGDGTSTITGNTSNGFAKITKLETSPTKATENLNNVRYIKDCVNGNTINSWSHWGEIQAIVNGLNVAFEKPISATGTFSASSQAADINDGDITTFAYITDGSLQCVTIDLEEEYNLDEVAIWRYWEDGRTYYNHTLSVGRENTTGTEFLETIIIDNLSGVVETSNGHRVNAYE